jgi:hypothetical protein
MAQCTLDCGAEIDRRNQGQSQPGTAPLSAVPQTGSLFKSYPLPGSDAVNKRNVFALSCAFFLAFGLISYSIPSHALGTAEERAACTPDVFRLCASEIPNVAKIIACLKDKKAELSPGCRTAVISHSTETAARTRSMGTEAAQWCGFRGVRIDAAQQNWLNWCGSAANK